MIGDMQKWTPNVAGIIEHAREIHPKTEVISRLYQVKFIEQIMKKFVLDLES